MRATRAVADVHTLVFRRAQPVVGADLALLRGRDPISKSELAAALGDDGEVLDTQRDYRTRLNDLLFGFAGEEQYQTMLRLMRDLRRPHLQRRSIPTRVAAQLTAGLPEIDDELMRRLGRRPRAARDARARPRPAARRPRARPPLPPRTYSAYARAVVRERAEALRQAQTAVENAADSLRDTQAELGGRARASRRAAAARDAAEADVARLSAEERRAAGLTQRGLRSPSSSARRAGGRAVASGRPRASEQADACRRRRERARGRV